jgi:hypothetical protein
MMNNKSIRTTLPALGAVIVIAIVAFIIGSASASAQCCPTYKTIVNVGLPAVCFPISIATTWTNGIGGNSVHNAPGQMIVTAPPIPGCWQSPILSIIINGINVPVPAIGTCAPVNLGCAWVKLCVQFDATGCLSVVVR